MEIKLEPKQWFVVYKSLENSHSAARRKKIGVTGLRNAIFNAIREPIPDEDWTKWEKEWLATAPPLTPPKPKKIPPPQKKKIIARDAWGNII